MHMKIFLLYTRNVSFVFSIIYFVNFMKVN